MNFEGYGILNSKHRNSILGFQQDESVDLEMPIESKIQQIKKESCLYLALISMTSSVIIYLYDQKIYKEQILELEKACQVVHGYRKRFKIAHKPKLLFVKRDTPLE